jgi:hypothetical protein
MIPCSKSGTTEALYIPFPVAARSKAKFYSRIPALVVGSKLAGNMDVFLFECCVLSDRGVCDQLITGPEESY